MRAARDLGLDTERLGKPGEIGIAARLREPVESIIHAGRLSVLRIESVQLSNLGRCLGRQSILDRPPHHREPRLKPLACARLAAAGPIPLWASSPARAS